MIELSDLLVCDSATLLSDGPSSFPGAAINSRDIGPGELFFALRGNRDGHDFVLDAIRAGAGGVVVEREMPGIPAGTAVVKVTDTLEALQSLGAATRARSDATIIAVTGSAGKTTTKSMLAHILASRFDVLSNKKSFNNHLGVPLNLLDITPAYSHVVAEVGTNHRGEISALAALVRPDVGVVTNVGFAHIGNFASRDELADEKTDLLRSVRPGGLWVVNGDDELLNSAATRQAAPEGVKVVRVGFGPANDLRASDVRFDESGTSGVITADGVTTPFRVTVSGRHFVYAVLLALAVGRACGIDIVSGVNALGGFILPQGRASITRVAPDLLVLDDSYNGSPDATLAALELLGGMPTDVKIAVLGEMRELGGLSGELHSLVGKSAASAATHLIVVGEATKELVEAARAEGFDSGRAWTVSSARDAYAAVDGIVSTAGTSCAVLAKGSRFMHMERVPLGIAGATVGCSLAMCPLYIHCGDCPKLEFG